MKVVYFCILLFAVLTRSFAQEIKVKSTWIRFADTRERKIVSFENDSMGIEFSTKDVKKYPFRELQQPRWKIAEYEGKVQLKDSLTKNLSDTTFIKIEVPFAPENIRTQISSAMICISYDLLKKGRGKIVKNNKVYRKIKHSLLDGPYGNKEGVFLLDNQIFFRYLISFGE